MRTYREENKVSIRGLEKTKGHINETYGSKPSGIIYSPFNMKLEPMKWLMPLAIGNDPDEVYTDFEPQGFDDNVYGKGLRILAMRKDGYVDVYHQPGLTFGDDFNQVGNGLGELIERPMEDARYEITSRGVDFYCSFEDKAGREIKIEVKENNQKQPKSSTVLAPLGSNTNNPDALPVYMLYQLRLIKVKRTHAQVTIAGRKHNVNIMPIIMDGAKRYFIRYSPELFLLKWNVTAKEELYPLEVSEKLQARDKETAYNLIDNNGYYEIKGMSVANEKRRMGIDFNPAVPDMIALREGESLRGKFTLSAEKETGTITGEYKISRHNNKINIKIHPRGGWKPNEPNWSMKGLYAMVPMFKNWTKTYTWHAEIVLNKKKVPKITSRWIRNNR